MDQFFAKDFQGGPFVIFSISHIIALLSICIFTIIMCIILKKEKMSKYRKPFRYTVGIILILQELSYSLWHISIGDFHPGLYLPFHLCGAAIISSAIMMFTKNNTLFELVYFWALGGATQALLTPELGIYDFPHYRYFQMFFLSHGLLVSTVFYMTIVEKYRPHLKSFIKVIIITPIYYVVVAGLNVLTDGNYMFICRKPDTPSLLDILGPWPWYILSVFGLGFIVFSLLYSPYFIKDLLMKRRKKLRDSQRWLRPQPNK